MSTKPAKSCKGCNTSTLKLILRSASVFLSQSPGIVNSSEASQPHTSRRCLARGASFGLATPPRKIRRNSDSESESESEPDSPRVSCVGKVQVKGKKKKKKKVKRKKMKMELETATENGARGSGVRIETAPYLNQMKRFASGRGSSLSGFEWD